MAKSVSRRPRPPKAEDPQSMHRRLPLSIDPTPTVLPRQPAPTSCPGDNTPTSSIYTTTITRALPLSTSTYARFITDSQADKTTTITQTIVEAGQRTTTETIPVTTTFCISRSILGAISSISSVIPSSNTTPSTISSAPASSTTNTFAVPSLSPTSDPSPSKPSKTPAIVAAAVLPVVVFILVISVFCCLRGRKAKKDDATVDEVALETMREENSLAEAERVAQSQTEVPITIGWSGGLITQDLINARLRWEHRGPLPAHGSGQQARNQLQRRPPGVLDSGTTLPVPGASSGVGTVVPDDSISVVQGLNPSYVIDHGLDSLVAVTPQDEENLEDLEDQDIQSPSRDSQVIETMRHVYQAQRERAKAFFSLHGGNVVTNGERTQSDGDFRESMERAERQWKEDEARAQQRALDEAEERLEQEIPQRNERNRERARQRASRPIRGLGVTDTNMTDFDVDAVNNQQANLPPRRHQPLQGEQDFGPYPLFISQARPRFDVYGSSSPDLRARTNLYERQIGEGSSGGAGPGPQTRASRERRGEDDEDPHAWLDVGPSSDGS